MALIVTTDYSKKLGLPGFSSHQFSVSIQTELTDLDRVPGEVARLYQLLQQAVDREIQQTGFVPADGYGETQRSLPAPNGHNGNGNNGHSNGNGITPRRSTAPVNGNGSWQCSDKQRRLLTDLSRELQLSEDDLDERAQRLFQRPARQLNKLSASGLITDLLGEAEGLRQSNGANGGNDKGHSAPAHRNGGGA